MPQERFRRIDHSILSSAFSISKILPYVFNEEQQVLFVAVHISEIGYSALIVRNSVIVLCMYQEASAADCLAVVVGL